MNPDNFTAASQSILKGINSNTTWNQFTGLQLLQSFKPLIIPCYSFVVFSGIVGNYLLIHVICKTKKMHNVTNFLIGNLAFSDMLMCATCVPLTLAYAFEPRGWVYGIFMCYFVFLMQPVTVFVSVFTLTVIAVDRYYATAYPLKRRLTIPTCAYILAAIWLLSCVLAAPALAHTYHVDFPQLDFSICEEFWVGVEKERLAYAYSTLIVTYVLPLIVISLSYLRISVKLKNRVVPGNITQSQAEWDRARRRKTFRLLVLVVAAFGTCWLPLHIFNMMKDMDINLIDKQYFNLIQLLCHWFAMMSACTNAILYAWLHDNFRGELKKMFAWRKKRIAPTTNCVMASVVL
ncbi:prolactin-releasing peptide receptor-like [Huso huso]|uniref:Prolactin-releasing peptide receptor n=4 Tax=Acipenseridae TaxID=7900 RepID=A0A444ULU6_ACIRT|nr:prolactin-releasing peptide receptor-like [Acipenser ruthenus]KAK1164702.1 prolactin-releasing peptide receptor-like [Acipenser oxyrinchus oxyrinchus]RXM36146.1 Prolactin-releasing peptide receptor [Acipenser ruthenus]